MRERGITKENDKLVGKQMQCLPYHATSSKHNRSIEGILKLDAHFGTVTEMFLNELTQIANCEHDAPRTVMLEQFELMPKKRAPCHIHQRFRNSIGERPEPRRLPSRQDEDRKSVV